MKTWQKLFIILVGCFLCFIAGIEYTGSNFAVIRCLLTCIAILGAVWVELSSSTNEV